MLDANPTLELEDEQFDVAVDTVATRVDVVDGQQSGQYLTFSVASGLYGVDILTVQEIRSWDSVTKVPNTPDFILGVLNIRGTVIPIIDLRTRFSLPPGDFGPTTVIVVLRVEHGDGVRIMGVLVDAVSDVCNVSAEELREAPDFEGAINSRFVTGLASVDGRMMTLLNTNELLNSEGLEPSDSLAG